MVLDAIIQNRVKKLNGYLRKELTVFSDKSTVLDANLFQPPYITKSLITLIEICFLRY